MTLREYLDRRKGTRTRCPACDSSDGLAVYDRPKTTAGGSTSRYEAGYFCCHACGAKGDGLKYLMDYEGRDFRGALEVLGLTMVPVDMLAARKHQALTASARRLRREAMQMCRDLVAGGTLTDNPDYIIGQATKEDWVRAKHLLMAGSWTRDEEKELRTKVLNGSADLVRVTLEFMRLEHLRRRRLCRWADTGHAYTVNAMINETLEEPCTAP